MKFSIITVTFNSERHIKDLLLSLSSQTYKNFEHIIIDNKSNDETLFLAKKYGVKYLIICSEEDKGIYFAMNKGLTHASGKFILFLNSDDWLYDKNSLYKIYKSIKINTEIIFANILIVNKSYPYKIYRKWDNSSINFTEGNHTPHPAFFASKKLFKMFGNFDTRFKIAADYDLMYRFISKISKSNITHSKSVSTVMRSGGASSNSLIAIIKSNSEILRFNTLKFRSIFLMNITLKKVLAKVRQSNLFFSYSQKVKAPSFSLNHVRTEILISIVYYDTDMNVFLKTIQSIIESTNINFFLVVINNSDINICFIEKMHKHIYVINHGGNIGFGKGHNLSLNSGATSQFFLVLNPDIEFNSDVLRKLIDMYKGLKNPGLLIPQLFFSDQSFQQTYRSFPSFFGFFFDLFRDLKIKHKEGTYEIDSPSGCFLFAKFNIFKSCNGFDERFFLYMEDIDLSYRISLNYKNYFTSDFQIIHKYQRASRKKFKNFILHLISFFKFYFS